MRLKKMSSRRRRISFSSIIGPRIACCNNWLLKGTSKSPSPSPSPSPSLLVKVNHPSCFLFVLIRSLSNTTKNPTSPPRGRKRKPEALPKQPCNLGPNHLHSALISFNRMLRMRPLPPISQFNKTLGSILKMGHYATALSLIRNKLQQLQGIQVDFYTCNIAINCYCHLNRVDFGLSLLGTLFKRGYTPSVITFTTLINGLILQDKTPQAVELFKKLMRSREIEPNVVMYGTIVNGLCRTGNTIRAVSLLRIMEEGSCKPDTVVYTTIIDSLCKDRMVDDALKLFSTMDEKGIFPNVVTYTSLIHGLCNFGQWKEATEMFKEMLDRGIAPNVHTYSVLLDACTKEGKMKEAKGVLEVMIQRGVDPNVVTYSTLMDGYCLQGQMDEAIRVLNTMVERGLHPNVFSYNILINGYCKKMKIDEAMHLFRELPRKGLKPDNGTFSAMLWGLFQTGRCGAAQKLFNDMQVEGIIPNSQTYGIILDGLCKNGHISEALSLFHMMESNRLHLDIVKHNILINAFCKDKKLDTARALFSNLSSKGLKPDVKTYTTMIHGFCKEGLLHEAKELFVKMEHNGCLPNDVTYNTIIRGFIGQHKCYEALILVEEMVQRGFSVDASNSSLIIDILSTKGQDSALQEVIKKFMPKDSHGMQEIEDFIRSHAQKYFLKVQKNGTIEHVPPPRPKHKAAHPYPQKAPKNGYSPWDDTSRLIHSPSGGIMLSQNEYNLHGVEDGIGSLSRTISSSELSKQGKPGSLFHVVYQILLKSSFIGSVFDRDTQLHAQKLKEMDPINFETTRALLLMRNLTINLSSPDFEPIAKVLSSYDVNSKTIGIATGNVMKNQEK
ncbi:unnamed protein product [Camellia sinensis]